MVATSYTDYRGQGFWANDTVIELWLHLLVQIGPTPTEAAWISPARDHWAIQASVGFHGCVDLDLNHHLAGDPHREHEFVTLVNTFDTHLASLGPTIPAAVATSYHVGGGGEFLADVDVGLLRRFSAAVIELVTTRSSDPKGDAPDACT